MRGEEVEIAVRHAARVREVGPDRPAAVADEDRAQEGLDPALVRAQLRAGLESERGCVVVPQREHAAGRRQPQRVEDDHATAIQLHQLDVRRAPVRGLAIVPLQSNPRRGDELERQRLHGKDRDAVRVEELVADDARVAAPAEHVGIRKPVGQDRGGLHAAVERDVSADVPAQERELHARAQQQLSGPDRAAGEHDDPRAKSPPRAVHRVPARDLVPVRKRVPLARVPRTAEIHERTDQDRLQVGLDDRARLEGLR